VDETRLLLARYGPIKALDSLGYNQARSVLAGEITEAAAVAATRQGHRNYAKRQMTWFRREPDVHWIESFGDSPETIEAAEALILRHMRPQATQT
jgi:tRNA dimethylallyltransferase